MTETKRPWQPPQLVVLVRARAEESVLIACKGGGQPGPSGTGGACKYQGNGGPCYTKANS